MQPVSGGQWASVAGTAAGTTVLFSRPCVLERVIMGTTTNGTVQFLDISAAGTANPVYTLAGTSAPFKSVEFGIQFRNGITYVSTGTTDMLAVVS
jgi:hypothetical protein